MRVIKWESLKYERERERERERGYICYNYKPKLQGEKHCCDCKAKKSITACLTKENSRPQYFSSYCFLGKNEIRNYFYIIG